MKLVKNENNKVSRETVSDKEAEEAFITSASNFVVSVIEIDGHIIGDGKIGETTKRLRDTYLTESVRSAR